MKLTDAKAWLCFYGDGDSDGRFLLGEEDAYTRPWHPDATSEICPVCSVEKSYYGCRQVTVTDV